MMTTHDETLALLAATERARMSLHHELTSLRAALRLLPTATEWAEATDEINRLRTRVTTQVYDARLRRESLETEVERLRAAHIADATALGDAAMMVAEQRAEIASLRAEVDRLSEERDAAWGDADAWHAMAGEA